MKADNNSLTEHDRVDLKNKTYNIFIEPSHHDYMRWMIALANAEKKENLKSMLEGSQSVPKPYLGGSGFEIRQWRTHGNFQTPWFQENYDNGYYKKDREYYMVLEFPDNIKELVGPGLGALVVRLDVDTREEEGWQEDVAYKKGSGYKLYEEDKSWEDAEAHCQSEGGHLASILTESEQHEVKIAANLKVVWVGGSDQEEEGVWKWSDGSSWNYTRWRSGMGVRGKEANCLNSRENGWFDGDCNFKYSFVCQSKKIVEQGQKSINLRFDSIEVGFTSFKVWYSYQYTKHKVLDSWENKLMTGFRLSWKIENPFLVTQMEFITDEMGKIIETPGFRGNRYQEGFHLTNQAYKATLLTLKANADEVGNGSLVIHLDVDTREAKGWQEEVTYRIGIKYTLYTKRKTWSDADLYCRSQEGKLAMILNESDLKEIKLVAKGNRVWIGASDALEEGVWKWTDQSLVVYTNWDYGSGNNGKGSNCVFLDYYQWYDWFCAARHAFVCQSDPSTLTGNTSITLEYRKKEIDFSQIEVQYNYIFNSSLNLMDIWKDKRMTGFRLNWYLQDSNGSRITEVKSNWRPKDWKTEVLDPRYLDPYLVRMVQLASRARASNITREEVIKQIIQEKSNLIDVGSIKYFSMCSGGHIKPEHNLQVFNSIHIQKIENESKTEILDEDIKTGFMMFSAIVYCSEPVGLYQFLHNLLSNQSPRTIIQATVNTIQSVNIRNGENRKGMNKFFLALDSIFNLQFGKILLATSSPLQLEAMIAKDWPYFSHYAKEINQCLSGTSCQGVTDIVNTLGKFKSP